MLNNETIQKIEKFVSQKYLITLPEKTVLAEDQGLWMDDKGIFWTANYFDSSKNKKEFRI